MVKQLGMKATSFGELEIGSFFSYEGDYYHKTGQFSAFNIKSKITRAMNKQFIVRLFEETGQDGLERW